MKQSSDQDTQPALSITRAESQTPDSDVHTAKLQRYIVISADVTGTILYKGLEPNCSCVQFTLAENSVEAQWLAGDWSGDEVYPLVAYTKQNLLDLIRCMENAEISEAHPSTIDEISYIPARVALRSEQGKSFTLTDDLDSDDLILDEMPWDSNSPIILQSQQAVDCPPQHISKDQDNTPFVSNETT